MGKIKSETGKEVEKFEFEAEILRNSDQKSIKRLINEMSESELIKTDNIYKKLNPIFSDELIQEFPVELSSDIDLDYTADKQFMYLSRDISFTARRAYISRSGFAVITKKFADKLAEYLNGKKCLEIMAGSGTMTKSLCDRGIDIIATDDYSWDGPIFENVKCEVEKLSATEAIKKYSDVDVILVSWMPLDVDGLSIVSAIREHNPDVLIISIEEDCTANDTWYDHIVYEEDDSFKCVADAYSSWYFIRDIPQLCRVANQYLCKF